MKLAAQLTLIAITLVGVLSASMSNPQGSGRSQSLMFDHLALQVHDVNKSATFYSEILGLSEIDEPSNSESIRWFDLGRGTQLHLIAQNDEQIVPKATHLALSTDDFHGFVTHLQTRNLSYSDWAGLPNQIGVRGDGVQQVYVQDPDGHWIEINDAR